MLVISMHKITLNFAVIYVFVLDTLLKFFEEYRTLDLKNKVIFE